MLVSSSHRHRKTISNPPERGTSLQGRRGLQSPRSHNGKAFALTAGERTSGVRQASEFQTNILETPLSDSKQTPPTRSVYAPLRSHHRSIRITPSLTSSKTLRKDDLSTTEKEAIDGLITLLKNQSLANHNAMQPNIAREPTDLPTANATAVPQPGQGVLHIAIRFFDVLIFLEGYEGDQMAQESGADAAQLDVEMEPINTGEPAPVNEFQTGPELDEGMFCQEGFCFCTDNLLKQIKANQRDKEEKEPAVLSDKFRLQTNLHFHILQLNMLARAPPTMLLNVISLRLQQ